ncbi:TonB-dependent receptor plug domain-containing protein [Phascolarctobacterium succinatutens]
MKKLASKGLLMSALICGNVLWGGTTVLANEVQEYELDEMVVTATRTAQENIKVPAQVNVITAEDIKNRNVLTITDALKSIPGLYDARVCLILQMVFNYVDLVRKVYSFYMMACQ